MIAKLRPKLLVKTRAALKERRNNSPEYAACQRVRLSLFEHDSPAPEHPLLKREFPKIRGPAINPKITGLLF